MVEGTLDWGLFRDAFTNLNIFGVEFIVSLILLMITMMFITREPSKWKVLPFPLLVSFRIIGIEISMAILLLAGFIFLIEALSIQMLGQIVQGITSTVTRGVQTTIGLGRLTKSVGTKRGRAERKADKEVKRIRKEQEKLKPFKEIAERTIGFGKERARKLGAVKERRAIEKAEKQDQMQIIGSKETLENELIRKANEERRRKKKATDEIERYY